MRQDLMCIFPRLSFSKSNAILPLGSSTWYMGMLEVLLPKFYKKGSYYNDLEDVPVRYSFNITSAVQGFHALSLLTRRGVLWNGFLTYLEVVSILITLARTIHASWSYLVDLLLHILASSKEDLLFPHACKAIRGANVPRTDRALLCSAKLLL